MQKCSKEKWEEEQELIKSSLSRYKIASKCDEWLRTTCPNCGQPNWVYMGIRFEACECFKCEKTFWISNKIYDDYETELTLAEVFGTKANRVAAIFEGLETPTLLMRDDYV